MQVQFHTSGLHERHTLSLCACRVAATGSHPRRLQVGPCMAPLRRRSPATHSIPRDQAQLATILEEHGAGGLGWVDADALCSGNKRGWESWCKLFVQTRDDANLAHVRMRYVNIQCASSRKVVLANCTANVPVVAEAWRAIVLVENEQAASGMVTAVAYRW